MNRHIGFERLHNVRDLGGYATADGAYVVPRTVYRADSLGKLQGADWEKFLGNLEAEYGSVQGYLTDRGGLDAETVERLRGRLLTDARP